LFYEDIRMIGRHFLVTNDRIQDVQRQYTVCSTMRKPVYDTILAQVKAALEGKKPEGDLSLFKDVRGNKITFSLKTYKTPRGLATDLFSSKDASYQIKGPMGSGLAMKKGGVHVAFCGWHGPVRLH